MNLKSVGISFLMLLAGTPIFCFAQDSAHIESAASRGIERLTFSVGDVLSITSLAPVRNNVTVAQNAKVLEIVGKWIFVKAKIGGSDESFWINVDNILLLRIEKQEKR